MGGIIGRFQLKIREKTSSAKTQTSPAKSKHFLFYNNMTTKTGLYYYNQGVDHYDRKDYSKAISSLTRFIEDTDSKKDKDVALAHR